MREGRVDSNIGTAALTMGVDICTGVLDDFGVSISLLRCNLSRATRLRSGLFSQHVSRPKKQPQ